MLQELPQLPCNAYRLALFACLPSIHTTRFYQAVAAFSEVQGKRYELFMDAFNHVSSVIDKTYKELTKSPLHPLGGTAYLNLENQVRQSVGCSTAAEEWDG